MSGSIVWQDFEKQNYAVIRGGLAGQSGDIPPELYMKKLEQTVMYEREDQLDDYFRATLKDRTPDQAILSQDLPRETQDMVRSEVMNIRHSAARTDAEPIHPDLFMGFTERDSRGYHNAGPDLKLYTNQSRKRGKFKDFVSDHASDWTIPEGTRSNKRVMMDLRKTIGPSKERLKIFDTSFDGRANKWSGSKTNHKSLIPKTTVDGTILNLNDATVNSQRKDNIKLRTDNIKVGWKQKGDHNFSVAKYGIAPAKKKYSNIHDSQYNNTTSHKFNVIPSEIQNRLSINIIKEVDRKKKLDHYRKDMEINFKESMKNQNNIGKIVSDLSTAQMSTNQTAEIVELGYLNSNIKKVRIYDPISHDTVIVDKDIFEKVKEAKNIKIARKIDPMMVKLNTHTKEGNVKLPGNEVQVMVYSRSKPMKIMPLETKMEHQWYDSKFEPVYKQNHSKKNIMDYSYTEAEQGVNPHSDSVFNSIKKAPCHTQGVRSFIDTQENLDPVNDVINYAPRQMMGRSKINVK
jgi:hypothetical protein